VSETVPASRKINDHQNLDQIIIEPRFSDPLNVVNSNISRKIIELVSPESVLVIDNSLATPTLQIQGSTVAHFLIKQDVKTTESSFEEIDSCRGEYDLAVIICSDSIISEKELLQVANLSLISSKVLYITANPLHGNQQWFAAEATAKLAGNFYELGFVREVESGLNGVGYRGNLFSSYSQPSQSNKSALVNLYETELALALGEIAKQKSVSIDSSAGLSKINLEVDDLAQCIIEKNRRISSLENRLADMTQKMYVARDSVAGAEAEKARADGVAAEMRYLSDIKDQELNSVLDELEEIKESPNSGKTAEAEKVPFKHKLLKFRLVRLGAKITRPIRNR